MKIIKYIFEAVFFYILFFFIKILGINFGRSICSFLLLNLGYIFRSKKLINNNILNALGNISDEERKK